MECPHCKLINPETAQRCDCGYNFTTKTLEEPYDRSREDQGQEPQENGNRSGSSRKVPWFRKTINVLKIAALLGSLYIGRSFGLLDTSTVMEQFLIGPAFGVVVVIWQTKSLRGLGEPRR